MRKPPPLPTSPPPLPSRFSRMKDEVLQNRNDPRLIAFCLLVVFIALVLFLLWMSSRELSPGQVVEGVESRDIDSKGKGSSTIGSGDSSSETAGGTGQAATGEGSGSSPGSSVATASKESEAIPETAGTNTNGTVPESPGDGTTTASMATDEVPTKPSSTRLALSGPMDDSDRYGVMANAVSVAGAESPLNVGPEVKSVVFVIDKSGSMAGNRIERTKAALIQSLQRLEKNQSFCVILFDTSTVPLNPFDGEARLKPATKNNVTKVGTLVRSVSGDGGTDPSAALELAVRLKPELIIFLSDGEFNPSVVNQITELNRQQRLTGRIDCVGLDENVLTLRELAKRNHGVYYQAASH